MLMGLKNHISEINPNLVHSENRRGFPKELKIKKKKNKETKKGCNHPLFLKIMEDFLLGKKIYPSITTTFNSDWREQIKEVKKLSLKEVCLFLTCSKLKERKEIYGLLKKTKIKKIPLVHLRTDMELWELDYLIKNYHTEAFNIHSKTDYPLNYDYSKYKDIIYIENVYNCFDKKELKNFGGICLDLSHLENDRILNKKRFDCNKKIIKKYRIGCNHISTIKKNIHIDRSGEKRFSSHNLGNLSEFDYLKQYPSDYFSPIIALELENSIKEQLLAKDYIINLFKK